MRLQRRRFCEFRLCSRLQPGGARSHFCLILLKTGFKCSQNTVKIPTPTDTAAFWVRKQTRPAFWGSNPVFSSSTLDGSCARARRARRVPGREAALQKILGLVRGHRRFFTEGLGRSSLPWENQSWGGSCDHRITGPTHRDS